MERSGLKTCSSFARIGGSVLASESITPLRLHRDRRSSKFRVNFLKDAEGLEIRSKTWEMVAAEDRVTSP